MKTIHFVLLSVLILNACAAPVSRSTPSQNPVEPIQETIENKEASIQNGVFIDPNSGVRFEVPEDSTLSVEKDGNGQYIRIQNYTADDSKLALAKEDFYIEVFTSESSEMKDCEEEYPEFTLVKDGIYSGLPDQGGDSGGERYGFCFDKASVYMQVTENNSENPVRKMIIDSLEVL